MRIKSLALGALVAALPSLAAAHVEVSDAYLRIVNPASGAAAVYMTIYNHSDVADRLFGVETDAAARVEIHTNAEDENGVVRMIELEDGISIASGATHVLEPGGDHVMLMGLTEGLEEGDEVELLLLFEEWIPITITVPVMVGAPMGGGHGHGHGDDHGGDHGDDHSGHDHGSDG